MLQVHVPDPFLLRKMAAEEGTSVAGTNILPSWDARCLVVWSDDDDQTARDDVQRVVRHNKAPDNTRVYMCV